METSLRDKVKDFGTVHRCYESISKHNQVRGWRWGGGGRTVPPGQGDNEPRPLHARAHAWTHTHTPRAGMQPAPGWSRSIPRRGG